MLHFSNIKTKCCLYLFLIFPPSSLLANEMSSTAKQIQEAVGLFFEDRNLSGAAKIDPLIIMDTCNTGIQVSQHRGQLKTLGVSCKDKEGGSLIVSARLNDDKSLNKLKNYRRYDSPDHKDSSFNYKVWVTTRTLRAGTVLMPDHIELKYWQGSSSQVFKKRNPPLRRQLRRTITTGKPVRERHLEASWDIIKGENATLEIKNGKINILTGVRSLENAFIGEKVKVQNVRSNREFLAYLKKNNIFQLEPLKILD